MQQPEQLIQERGINYYQNAFNFFQSKPINSILSRQKTQIPIQFRDLQFMSDQIQYLKRFYLANQSLVRILKLINYYQYHLEPPFPNYIPLESYQIFCNRIRKLNKLTALKQKQNINGEAGEEKEEKTIKNMKQSLQNLLEYLDNQKLSQLDVNPQDNSMQSFDSEIHDIYENTTKDSKQKYSKILTNIMVRNIFDLKYMKQSKLIIDFAGENGINSNDNMKNQKNKICFSSTPSEVEPPYFITSANSELKCQKKKASFSIIEYYNSLPKKQKSNIIKKYIKQKK